MATKLISTAEAAAALNVHRSTISRMVKANKIKPAAQGDGVRGAMFFYPSAIRKAKVLLRSAMSEEPGA